MKLKELIVFAIGFSVSLTSLAQPYLIDLDRSKIYSEESFLSKIVADVDRAKIYTEASILAHLDSATLKERQLLAILKTLQMVNLQVDIMTLRSGHEGEDPVLSQLNSAIKYGSNVFSDNPEIGFRNMTLELYLNHTKVTCIASVRLYLNEPLKVISSVIRNCPQEFWEMLREKGVEGTVYAYVPYIEMGNFSLKD